MSNTSPSTQQHEISRVEPSSSGPVYVAQFVASKGLTEFVGSAILAVIIFFSATLCVASIWIWYYRRKCHRTQGDEETGDEGILLGKSHALVKGLEQKFKLSAPYLSIPRAEDDPDHIHSQGKYHREVLNTCNTMKHYGQPSRPNPGVCTPDIPQIPIQDVDEMTLVEDKPSTLHQAKLGGHKSLVC